MRCTASRSNLLNRLVQHFGHKGVEMIFSNTSLALHLSHACVTLLHKCVFTFGRRKKLMRVILLGLGVESFAESFLLFLSIICGHVSKSVDIRYERAERLK